MAIQKTTYAEIKSEKDVRSSESEQIMNEIKGREKDDQEVSSLDTKVKGRTYENLLMEDGSLTFEEEMDEISREQGKDKDKNKEKEENEDKKLENQEELELSDEFLERQPSDSKGELTEKGKNKDKNKDKKKIKDTLLEDNEDNLIAVSAGNNLHTDWKHAKQDETSDIMDKKDCYETTTDLINREVVGEESVHDIHLFETSKDVLGDIDDIDDLDDLDGSLYQQNEIVVEKESDVFDKEILTDNEIMGSGGPELTNKYWSN